MAGKLLLIGGGETQKITNSYDSALLKEIFENCNLKHIEIIVSPSNKQQETQRMYERVFKKIMDVNPNFLFLEENKLNASTHHLDRITKADLIFFAGGDQTKIMGALSKAFIKLIQQRYREDEVCVAGTSAGAMILSNKIIASGSNDVPQVDEELNLSSGLALIPEVLIDTHFIERGRFARLAHAIDKYPKLLGIGVEANNAIMVENEHFATTFGCGSITFIDGSAIRDYEQVPESKCVLNLKVHLLVPGCKFNLKSLKMVTHQVLKPRIAENSKWFS